MTDAIKIEILAARYAARIANESDARSLPSFAYDGWVTHRNGWAPVVGRWGGPAGVSYLAGWLARQIWSHGENMSKQHGSIDLSEERLTAIAREAADDEDAWCASRPAWIERPRGGKQ